MTAVIDWAAQTLLLVLTLFLCARALVIAGPVAGRVVARWTMIVGTPLIAVLVAAGQFAFGKHWESELEPILLTAFIVAMLLTVLFIGRGVVWLARRMMGRSRARPAPAAPRFESVRMAAAIAVLAALPELIQWDFYRDEMAAEAHAQVTQQKLLNALTVTANKLPEFARERELLDAKGKQLRRIVPESLGVVDFVEELRAVCQQHAFRIWSWEARELTQERVHRAELTLVLEGDAANLKALSDRIDKKTLRLVAWTVDGVAGARVAARATIYAIPAWPVKAAPDSCASPRTQVWLWPWRSKLEQARRKRWELCREQERLGPVRKQVDALEVDRQRFRELIDIVEPLMSERHAARGGAPDAHRDPEPPPPPVPAVKEKRGAADKQT